MKDQSMKVYLNERGIRFKESGFNLAVPVFTDPSLEVLSVAIDERELRQIRADVGFNNGVWHGALSWFDGADIRVHPVILHDEPHNAQDMAYEQQTDIIFEIHDPEETDIEIIERPD